MAQEALPSEELPSQSRLGLDFLTVVSGPPSAVPRASHVCFGRRELPGAVRTDFSAPIP